MSIWEHLQGVLQGGKKGDPKDRRGRTEVVHQMEVVSWNTGGVPGVYRVLELMELGKLEFDCSACKRFVLATKTSEYSKPCGARVGTTHTSSKGQRLKQSTDRLVTREG